MRKLLFGLGIGASIVLSSGFAHAGDGYGEPRPLTWSGFYVGAHVGYGWGDMNVDLSDTTGALIYNDPFVPSHQSLDVSDGAIGGLQIGANHQLRGSGLVLGVEADISWANVDGNGTFFTAVGPQYAYKMGPGTQWDIDTRLEMFGTARARVGLATGPMLLYVTGGVAWARTEIQQATTHPNNIPGARVSGDGNHIGWTAGAGGEWMLGGGWSLKAEYLYVDLGSDSYKLTGTQAPGNPAPWAESFSGDLDLHIVRAGLNYRFGG